MNDVLGHGSALVKLYLAGDNLGYNEMNYDMNHAPGAGSIARPRPAVQHATTVSRMPTRRLQ